MKLLRFCSTAVLSLLMAGVLVAQSAQQPPAAPRADQQPPRATQPATTAADAAEMTIVGCLAQSKTDDDDYTLTVTPAGTAEQAAGAGTTRPDATRATNPGATAGSAARTAAGMTPATYKIVGIDDDQLKGHVNHQVELKGRLEASASTPSASAPSASATQSAAPKEFRATAVKMVSATCPPAR